MLPFGIQPFHLIIILVVALLIFGPQRLPEMGRGIGRALTEFRKGAREMSEGFKDEVTKPIDETENKIFPAPAASQPVASVSQPVAMASQPVAVPPGETIQDPSQPRVFCNQCGTPNPLAALFCNKCGAKIATD